MRGPTSSAERLPAPAPLGALPLLRSRGHGGGTIGASEPEVRSIFAAAAAVVVAARQGDRAP